MSEKILHETKKVDSHLYQSYNLFKYTLSYMIPLMPCFTVDISQISGLLFCGHDLLYVQWNFVTTNI